MLCYTWCNGGGRELECDTSVSFIWWFLREVKCLNMSVGRALSQERGLGVWKNVLHQWLCKRFAHRSGGYSSERVTHTDKKNATYILLRESRVSGGVFSLIKIVMNTNKLDPIYLHTSSASMTRSFIISEIFINSIKNDGKISSG